MKDYMQSNYSNLGNININNILNVTYIISFIFQWSLLSMIINLFTMGMIRRELFVIFILDAISMLIIKDKSIIKPSFILTQLWNLISFIFKTDKVNTNNPIEIIMMLSNARTKISDSIKTLKDKITNVKHSINSVERENRKYEKTRNLNKFSDEIGSKVTVESVSNGEYDKKTFKYKDRTQSYVHMLEANGYKNYRQYSLNPQISKSYIIINKNKDLIDIENNRIDIKHDHPDYKFIIDGWKN
ncbi:MAG: hypothetical protein IKF79_02665 [Methanosphaera sp.]|nr:hypothetical protein [Methanosphaera sp.]